MNRERNQILPATEEVKEGPVGCWRRTTEYINKLELSGGTKIGYFYILFSHFLSPLGSMFIQKLNGIPSYQLVYFRGIILFVVNWMACSSQKIELYSKVPTTNRKLFLRGLNSLFGFVVWVYGLQNLPLSEAITLFQTGPVFTGLFAIYFLNEKFDLTQGITVVMSLLGSLLVLKPPFLFGSDNIINDVDKNRFLGGICCLLTAVNYGGAYIIVRDLRNECHGQTTVHYIAVAMSLVTPVLILLQGVTIPTMQDCIYLMVMALLLTAAQSLLTRGLRFSTAGKSSILGYSQILFSFIIDIISNHPLDLFSILGAASICSSVIVLFYEKKKG